jgi:glutathione synthase/RimK-type ligase-like ATP-grasp enzyme
MILLLGVPGDTPLARVHAELIRQEQACALIDQRAVLEMEADVSFGNEVEGTIRIGQQVIELSSVTAVYQRPYGLDQLPVLKSLDRQSPQWRHATNFTEIVSAWTELSPALVVNRLSAMASNGSKPYQSRLIQAHGFETPDTMVTTDPEAVRDFWLRHGTVIYKSISGVRSIVNRLTADHVQRFPNLHWCPTQFQQYIPGNDYRVHVVGEETFAAEIVSEADDYRYAGRKGLDVKHRAWDVPIELAERCRSLARILGLHVAGIDLRYHPAGRWFCFEVNPSPAHSYYQDETGQPIDAAIARLLIAGKAIDSVAKASEVGERHESVSAKCPSN